MRISGAVICASVASILMVSSLRAGLIINTTFDSSVTSRGDAASWISAWNYATNEFQTQYSDNITINLTFQASTSGLGSSNTNLQFIGGTVGTAGYAAMKAILLADSKTANDASAYSHLS